ncbi:Regulator of chromosome condensation (RCC1) repeat-containing protein, partial [Anaerobranca californiensis DSM 14826]
MFCSNCGAKLRENANFCNMCGKELEKNMESRKQIKDIFSNKKLLVGVVSIILLLTFSIIITDNKLDMQITAGLGHSFALTKDGKVYAWGWN